MDNKVIKVWDKEFIPYKTREEIAGEIRHLAGDIKEKNKGKDDIPIMLCALHGSIPFTADLVRELDFPLEIATVKPSSYKGTESTGTVMFEQGLSMSVEGRRVFILEDIIDTGITLEALVKLLRRKRAKEVHVYSLLFKPEAFKVKIDLPLNVGFAIPNYFVLGYGMDYDGLGRNLPDLYRLKD